MKRNNSEILMACDKNYFSHTLISCWSFYMNDSNLSFNVIIDFDIEDTNFNLLEKDFRDKFNFIDICTLYTHSDFETIDSNGTEHISSMTFARIASPNIPYLNKVLYVDSDVIFTKGGKKLFTLSKRNDYTIYGAKNYFIAPVTWTNVYKKYEMNENEISRVINAGVLLMDLSKLREANFYLKSLDWYKKNKDNWMDQAIINVLLKDSIKFFSPKYNWGVHRNETYREKYPFVIPKILHFASSKKPWNSITPFMGEYEKVLKDFIIHNPELKFDIFNCFLFIKFNGNLYLRGNIENFDDFQTAIESNKISPLKDYKKFKRRLYFDYGFNNR